MTISELAYELYKIEWLSRYSADTMSDFVKQYYNDCKIDSNDDSTLTEVFEEFGFDGEIYVCYEEFLDNEYQDKEYMRDLLDDDQYEDYLADIGDENDEEEEEDISTASDKNTTNKEENNTIEEENDA